MRAENAAAAAFEARWTRRALYRVDPLLAERLDEQRQLLSDAFGSGIDRDIRLHGEAMVRGWHEAIARMNSARNGDAEPDDAYLLGQGIYSLPRLVDCYGEGTDDGALLVHVVCEGDAKRARNHRFAGHPAPGGFRVDAKLAPQLGRYSSPPSASLQPLQQRQIVGQRSHSVLGAISLASANPAAKKQPLRSGR